MPTILGANTLSTGAYEVANSLRLNGDAYGQKSISSSGSGTTATFSAWVKPSALPDKALFTSYIDSNNFVEIYFNSGQFRVYHYDGGSVSNDVQTNAYFRDQSAWYHFHVIFDTTNGTEADRIQMYVNGTRLTDFKTANYPTSSQDLELNSSSATFNLAARNGDEQFKGYMAEVVWLDGTASAVTNFGEYDEDSPTIWKPKDVSGLPFGTNGFYLDFEDSSNLGNDVSGGTDFTETNLAATDQSTDTCTNNFVTWNPLDNARTYSGTIDLSEGNLRQSNANDASLISTVAVNKGKWYMEFKVENSHNTRTFGIIDMAESNGYVGHHSVASAVSYGYKSSTGTLYIGTSEQASSVGTTGAGDIVSIALDLDSSTNSIKWQKNGSNLSGTTELSLSHTGYYWAISCRCDGGQNITANFGSPPYSISSGNSDANGHGNFEYAVPSGYFALCTKNLAEFA